MTLLNNRYQVLRVLGSGGFGKTFLAEDTQMPSGKRCVIKQLIPVTNNPQLYQLVQERFQKEASILEELGDRHSQIPRLYAYFSEGGEFYLIQEYIEGQTLSEKLQQQGVFNEVTVKEILISILQILEYVHSKGIVHRDIKPDNIILRFSDSKPVLIDFGAVKVTMNTEMSPSGNSSQSIVIGTPGFMPMEQIAGRPLFSSDLYSLGLTAICLLTGKIPQDLPTEPTMGNILWRHFAPYLNVGFGDILDKAIAYHPRERFTSAREMLTALQTLSNPVVPAFVPIPQSIPTVIAVPSSLLHQNTIAISPGNHTQNFDQTNQNSAKTGIIIASLITSIFIGGSIIIGFSLNKQPQIVTEKIDSQPINTQSPTISDKSIENQPLSLGWMRLGAVNNTSGVVTVEEQLISTKQPVTISPAIVPKIGDQVTVINGVNLRINRPQKPDYKLPDKKGVVVVGQKLVIINLDYFIDSSSPSPYTAVWAEVGLNNQNTSLSKNDESSLPQSSAKTETNNQELSDSSTLNNSIYFVADSAFADLQTATKKLKNLQIKGYSQSGIFWIPDYPNLSGTPLYQVYANRFSDITNCINFLKTYGKINSDSYCILASKDANTSPNRVFFKEISNVSISNTSQTMPDFANA
ncbi:MAG: protein kinase domain-containing protein [Dolichospermum sp.]|jgi:serine/threonine protein kinase|nr:serine/threonine protein kinase [Anabaena sp. 49628_E55]